MSDTTLRDLVLERLDADGKAPYSRSQNSLDFAIPRAVATR
jgi:hypothetical protein